MSEQKTPEFAASSKGVSWALSLPPVPGELCLQKGILWVPSSQPALGGNILQLSQLHWVIQLKWMELMNMCTNWMAQELESLGASEAELSR